MIFSIYLLISLSVIYLIFSQKTINSVSMFMLGVWFFITTPSFIINLSQGQVIYGYSFYNFNKHYEASIYSLIAVALIIPFSIISSRVSSIPEISERILGARLTITIAAFFIPVILMYVVSGQIPIVSFIKDLIEGDGGRLNDYRSANISYLTGEGQYFGQGYFSDWALNIFTFVVALSFFDKKQSNSKLLTYLFMVFFANAAGGRRWPMFIAILYLIVSYVRTKGIKPIDIIKNRLISTVGIIVFSIGFIITVFQGRFIQYGDLISTIPIALKEYLLRFSIVSGIAYSTAIEYFGNQEPYRLGETYVNDILRLLQFPLRVLLNINIESKVPFSVEFYSIQNFGQQGFTAAPTLLGGFYANFGLFGIIAGVVLLSSLFLLFDTYLSNRATVEVQIFYAFCCVLAFTVNTGDLLTFVVYIIEFIIALSLIRSSRIINPIKYKLQNFIYRKSP